MNPNPDLIQPDIAVQPLRVAALASITPPMPNTKQTAYVYFHCTMAVAAMHRQDGKKLPFIQHVLKTNIKEDIEYLNKEIDEGNQYIRRATPDEVQRAQIMEDPLGAVRTAIRKELTIEELEVLLAERRAAVATGANSAVSNDAGKIAGVDANLIRTALKAQDVRAGSGTTGIASTKAAAVLAPLSTGKL
jgi:lysyl-tRNA synthetase class I